MIKKINSNYILCLILIGFASILRFWSLPTSPFWIDEFSTAHEAHLLQTYGWGILTQKDFFFEFNKLLPSFITTLAFAIGGTNELAARIPFLIIGTLIPPALYLLAKEWYGRTVACCAGLFAVFSYSMITWSRQARGYVLLQLLILLLFLSYTHILRSQNKKQYLFFIVISLAGILTHPFFLIGLAAVSFHALLLARNQIKYSFVMISIGIAGVALSMTSFLNHQHLDIKTQFATLGIVNNLSYYHSYLWRTQTIMTFLGLIGILLAYPRHRRPTSLMILYIVLHLFFICFLFGPFVIRYTLPILPFLFIGAAAAITIVVRLGIPKVSRIIQIFSILALTGFIILNGDTFSPKPKQFYSVNHEFREIALINYPELYDIIKRKTDLSARKTAVIDTWPDRTGWYIGYDYPHIMLFRWIDAGLMKKTAYVSGSDGKKYVVGRKNVRFVPDLKSLKKVMREYPSGFLIIDDTSLPQEVQEFAQTKLKKELYLDHYTFDDNPYSIWPVTLYSWGVQ